MMFQCCTATTGGEDDTGLIDPYVFRGDDFIGLPAFQYTVLVDADEWAKALRPTMALLGCTGTRIKLDTSWLVAMICLVLIPILKSRFL